MSNVLKTRYTGTTIEKYLPEDCGYNGCYIAVCTYKYNKNNDKYSLEMGLKRKDIGDLFRIDRQEIDTQYISGSRETIMENIDRIIEQASKSGFFDYYVKRYEYTLKCFERGNELFEKERLENKMND